MTSTPSWLPEIITLDDYGGAWEEYVEAIYSVFEADFVSSKPLFEGHRLRLKRHPLLQGKECTFWHMVSEGNNEGERTPNLRRCERITWVKPIIEHTDDSSVKHWENRRKNETRVCLWLEQLEYLVILAKRQDYTLPWTAYTVTRDHNKRKLQREYDTFKNAGTEP